MINQRSIFKNFILIGAIISAALFPVVSFGAAGINKQLPYQGVLKTSGGVKVSDGNYDIIFKIYDAPTGGNILWTGTHTAANGNAVTVTDGVFSVLLGSGSGNAITIDFSDDALYLGVKIGVDSEMTPRKRIGSAGYAFNTDKLDGVDSLSFLRSDEPDTISASSSTAILTVTQSGIGDILNLFDGVTPVFVARDGGNVGIGTASPNNRLQVSGLINFNDTDFVTLIGKDAGANIIPGATHNTFLGYEAGKGSATLSSNTADNNTGLGFRALFANESGAGNVAVGWGALDSSTVGSNNVAVGLQAVTGLTTGINNTGLGTYAMLSTNSGSHNVAIGRSAFYYNQDGGNNIAIGYLAGGQDPALATITTLNNSVMIGHRAKPLANSNTNEIVIGYLAEGNGSNSVTIGNNSITKSILKGNVGIGTSAPAMRFHVSNTGQAGAVARFTDDNGSCDIDPTNTALSCVSDASLKKNILTLNGSLEKILALNPIIFNWNGEEDGAGKHFGFVAQEVEQIFPELVSTNEQGIKSLAYGNFAPILTKTIQEIALLGETFKQKFIAWFSNEVNGIVDFFAKKIHTEQICLKKSDGNEYCVNGDDLEAIMNGRGRAIITNQESMESSQFHLSPETTASEVVSAEQSVVIEEQTIIEQLTEEPAMISDISSEIMPIVIEAIEFIPVETAASTTAEEASPEKFISE